MGCDGLEVLVFKGIFSPGDTVKVPLYNKQWLLSALRLVVSRRHGKRGHRDLGLRIWIMPDRFWRLAGMPAEGEVSRADSKLR